MTESIGIKTGFDTYDNEFGGLQKGQLILVEGRACTGKASFALSLVDNLCKKNEGTCLCFTVESNPKRFIQKLMKMHCGFESMDQIKAEEWNVAAKEGKKMSEYNLVVDGLEVTMEKLLSKSIEVASTGPISAIIVDGISFIADSNGSRIMSIYPALKKLKELAIALNCPIVAYTTLSRFKDKDAENYPEINDFYYASNYIKTVDEVMFLYNEQNCNNESEKKGKIEIGSMNYIAGKGCTFEMEFAC